MRFSLELSIEEEAATKSYARMHGISLNEAFKRSLFEKIEDEYDVAVAQQAHDEYEEDPITFCHEEVLKEFKI